MFYINIKIALRNLWKHRGYTFINTVGLSIGMTCALIIFLFIRQYLSADNFHPNADRIFRVVSLGNGTEGKVPMMGVPVPMAGALRTDFPQLEKVANLVQGYHLVEVVGEDRSTKQYYKEYGTAFYTDPAIFDIFNFPWALGEPASLNAPNHIALTQSTATQYFGNWQNAMGKKLKLSGDETFYEVTGIIKDLPKNTDFPIHLVISYQNFGNATSMRWNSVNMGHNCYVMVKPNTDIKQLQVQLDGYTKKYYDAKDPLSNTHLFQPFSDVHLDSEFGNFSPRRYTPLQINSLRILGSLILLIACINFINMATAQAIGRSKEVGIRKVLGSNRKQLLFRFLAETFVITFVAITIACIATEIALPAAGNFLGQQIPFNILQYPVILAFILILWLAVSFLAGLYPAVFVSGYNPINALKNKISQGNKGIWSLRSVLLIFQFTITLIFIIGTLVVLKQIDYFKNKSLGFNNNAILQVDVPTDSISKTRFDTFKQKLLQRSGVEMVTYAYTPPSTSSNNFTSFYFNNSSQKTDFLLCNKPADEDYFKIFGLKMIAGKPLSKSDTVNGYILNETLLHKLHLKDPKDALGKYIQLNRRPLAQIIGVVKDFNNLSLHGDISPVIFYTSKEEYASAFVKLNPLHMQETVKEIGADFKSTFPDQFYEPSYYDEYIANYYIVEEKTAVLLSFFTSVAIFISCFGLFALISFVAVQRTKEMAIRKVLGATTIELISVLNQSFMKMIVIANLIAWPLAYILLNRWLQGFAYKIDLPMLPFVLAALGSIGIIVLTVALRTYKMTTANPVEALKYD
ncbi:ABC transporter permease [Pedobacter panaciterrae]|uniref:ABC transporter permease n=1 Tax=Pedobacter panaciterrae TaxID=363849 RepID=UPI00155DAEDB|nr:ABC transporter permease [Pedobacter panaciterrae]NQX57190.1 ABC transporter permease [Pedobacter panaciterrae]